MIFLAVSEDPENAELIAERDRFLAKSEDHKQAYEKVERGWEISNGRPRPILPMLVPLVLALGAAAYFSWQPLRIQLMADVSTQSGAEQHALTSGDLAYLDAGSAITDETRSGTRMIELLKGSAFFEVEQDDRPFIVRVGDAEVSVIGTSFETALMPDGVSVSVAEGVVNVAIDAQSWRLVAGDALTIGATGAADLRAIDTTNVATWRGDQLVADDMTIGQVADVLDRRITGDVLVMDGTLADTRVSGTFDLEDPRAALETLALIGNARVIRAGPVATILLPKD